MGADIIEIANAIRSERYSNADVIFAAGSIVRGEGTPFSDLDLVVIYAQLPCAYRESFRFGGYPVEAFVHDPATIEYFFEEVDKPSGVPALPHMVMEGIEIPGTTEVSRRLKRRAAAVLEAGPEALDTETERRMRYFVTDLLDDLRAPRNHAEMIGAGAQLYEQLVNHYLRRRGLGSAKGKAIPRVLSKVDPALGARYEEAFDALFTRADQAPVVRLAEDLLNEAGRPLFEGYRSEAPPAWRRQPGG